MKNESLTEVQQLLPMACWWGGGVACQGRANNSKSTHKPCKTLQVQETRAGGTSEQSPGRESEQRSWIRGIYGKSWTARRGRVRPGTKVEWPCVSARSGGQGDAAREPAAPACSKQKEGPTSVRSRYRCRAWEAVDGGAGLVNLSEAIRAQPASRLPPGLAAGSSLSVCQTAILAPGNDRTVASQYLLSGTPPLAVHERISCATSASEPLPIRRTRLSSSMFPVQLCSHVFRAESGRQAPFSWPSSRAWFPCNFAHGRTTRPGRRAVAEFLCLDTGSRRLWQQVIQVLTRNFPRPSWWTRVLASSRRSFDLDHGTHCRR